MQPAPLDLQLVRDILASGYRDPKGAIKKLNPEGDAARASVIDYHLEAMRDAGLIRAYNYGTQYELDSVLPHGADFLKVLSDPSTFKELVSRFGHNVDFYSLKNIISTGLEIIDPPQAEKKAKNAPAPKTKQKTKKEVKKVVTVPQQEPIQEQTVAVDDEPKLETNEPQLSAQPALKTLTEREAQISIALRRNPNFWWLNANPDRWQMSSMNVGDIETYTLYNEKGNPRNQHKSFLEAKPGDLVLGYETGKTKQVQALFEITQGAHGPKGKEVIAFRLLQFLPKHPDWADIKVQPAVSALTIAKQQAGSLFDLNLAAFREIMVLAGIDMDAIERVLPSSSKYKFRDLNAMEPAIGAEDLASEIADLIKGLSNEPGMMVGIFGRWGRGKTYLFNLIWDRFLKPDGNFSKVEFHAWKYQDTEASWAYLYEVLAEQYFSEAKTWWGRKWRLTRLNFKRGNYWELIVFLVSLGLGLYSLQSQLSLVEELLGKGLALLGVSAALMSGLKKFYHENASKAKELMKKYTSRHSYTHVLGIQAEIQKEINILFDVWFKGDEQKKVVLFVDDIDRCNEERIIEIVDALRVMLDDQQLYNHLVVVAAIDERILRRAIRLKYTKLLRADGDEDQLERRLNDLTEEYMDKLFIAGIRLGELMPSEKAEIFAKLTEGHVEPITVGPNAISTPGSSTSTSTKPTATQPTTPVFDPGVVKLKEQEAFEINSVEAEEINEGITLLNNSTPRQIRICYYRYILARNFLRNLNGLSQWGGNREEIKVTVRVIVYLTNADLMGEDVLEIIEDLPNDDSIPNDVKTFLSKMEDRSREDFYKILEMVVAY